MQNKEIQEISYILKELVKIDTSKSLNNEKELVDYIKKLFDMWKMKYEVFEPYEGKASIVAKIKGKSDESIVLYSHLDTENLNDLSKWKYHPLEGKEVNGNIIGRGTLDCKGLVAIWLAIVKKIANSNQIPNKTLIFVGVADEESGGEKGIKWLLENTNYFDKSKIVLSEGGGYPIKFSKNIYFTCQIGEKEKVYFNDINNFNNISEHNNENEVIYTGNILINLFKSLKRKANNINTILYLKDQILSKQTVRRISLDDYLKNQVSILDRKKVVLKLPYLKNEEITYKKNLKIQCAETKFTKVNSKTFKIIQKQLKKVNSNYKLLPYITPGYSDNRYFRKKGIEVYGFFPLDYNNNISGIHGYNEYISKKSISFSYTILLKIVRNIIY